MATVMIDAGHGGYDNGASFEGRTEKNDTLNLALAVGNILENKGVDVLYTRTTDVYQSPSEKANIANRSDAAYFISIHRNSSTEPETYSGVQTLVYADAGIPALFAKNINEELERVGFTNLGTEVRPNLAVLRRTNMPAALAEVLQVSQAIANGILETIQGANLESSEVDNYSVEVGTFMHHNNAEGLAKNIQEDGYSCYIEPVSQCFRVCAGAFPDMESAREVQRKLFEKGYEARIIER